MALPVLDSLLRQFSKRCPKESASWIPPMLCETGATVPAGPNWTYEVKLDGYRAQAIKVGDFTALLSRNCKPLHFPGVQAAVGQLPVQSVVLDGEIVALDQRGRPSFQILQATGHRRSICMYAFDVLLIAG